MISAGDVVRLNSGSPRMVVVVRGVFDEIEGCKGRERLLCRLGSAIHAFPEPCLTLVERGKLS